VWGEALAAGLTRRSADLGPLETIAGGSLAFCDDEEQAKQFRDLTRPFVALYVGGMGARGRNFYNDIFVRYGYAAEARKIQDAYLDGHHADAAALIPDEFLEHCNLIGDEGFIRDRVDAFRAAGVTYLQATPIGPDPLEDATRLKEILG
jgi:hypothetical protein